MSLQAGKEVLSGKPELESHLYDLGYLTSRKVVKQLSGGRGKIMWG